MFSQRPPDPHEDLRRRATNERGSMTPVWIVLIIGGLLLAYAMITAEQRYPANTTDNSPWTQPTQVQPAPPAEGMPSQEIPGEVPTQLPQDLPEATQILPTELEPGLLPEGTVTEASVFSDLGGQFSVTDTGCYAQPVVTLTENLIMAEGRAVITVVIGNFVDTIYTSGMESSSRQYRTVAGCGIWITIEPGEPGNPIARFAWLRIPGEIPGE